MLDNNSVRQCKCGNLSSFNQYCSNMSRFNRPMSSFNQYCSRPMCRCRQTCRRNLAIQTSCRTPWHASTGSNVRTCRKPRHASAGPNVRRCRSGLACVAGVTIKNNAFCADRLRSPIGQLHLQDQPRALCPYGRRAAHVHLHAPNQCREFQIWIWQHMVQRFQIWIWQHRLLRPLFCGVQWRAIFKFRTLQ